MPYVLDLCRGSAFLSASPAFFLTSARILAGSSVTSETRFISADHPDEEWEVILPRVNDVEYDVKHRGDHFIIEIRDANRPNSEVLVAPVADPSHTKVIIHLECLGCAGLRLECNPEQYLHVEFIHAFTANPYCVCNTCS